MPGLVSTAPPTNTDIPTPSAVYQVTGTGTTNDNRWVSGVVPLDPLTGLPQYTTDTAQTSLLTTLGASVSTVTLLPARTNRKNTCFFNNATGNLYLFLGGGATVTQCTVKIPAGGYYELPVGSFGGLMSGVWDATGGSVYMTELY